ncbi:MAG: hypothetical protein WBG36_17255, partial [Ornithinimicrobium sp.]
MRARISTTLGGVVILGFLGDCSREPTPKVRSGAVAVATDLDAFQAALDKKFGTTDTETFVWIFTATGTLSSL